MIFSLIVVSNRFRVNVTVQSCDVKQSFNIESDQIIPLSIISALLVLIALATAIDVVRRYRGQQIKILSNKLIKCWLSFSMCVNSRRLLNCRESDGMIKPLNGMKVISLIWIMLAHTYMTLDFRALGRLISTRELPKGFLFQIVLNASLAIETFFFLSGTLVTYQTLKKMKSSARWRIKHWVMFYVHRYIRLTPGLSRKAIGREMHLSAKLMAINKKPFIFQKCYSTTNSVCLLAAIMLLIVLLLFAYRLGNGPLWQELIHPTVQKCRESWWTHALYINNFILVKDMVIFILTTVHFRATHSPF